MGSLEILDFVTIGLYAGVLLTIGLVNSYKQSTLEEYTVGKRNMNPIFVGISLMATLFSTITYLAIPGEVIRYGPGLMWMQLGTIPLYFFVGYLVIPRIMRYKVTSAYELLVAKFGTSVQKTAAILFMFVRIFWMGFILFTCTMAVSVVTGIDMWVIILIVGIFTTIYSTIGGVRGVIFTDFVQSTVLFGGAVFSVGFITYYFGGFGWWPDFSSSEIAALDWQEVPWFSLNPFTRTTVLSVIIMRVLYGSVGATSDQVVIQRYLCTRDTVSARRSFLNSQIAAVTVVIAIWLTGFALLGFVLQFPEHIPDPSIPLSQQGDLVFPHFIGEILPAGLTGLLVAALLSAAMSSLSSGVNSISTVLMTDLKKITTYGCNGDETKLVRRAKVFSLAAGGMAICASFITMLIPGENLYDISARVMNPVSTPLFALFLMLLFVPFCTRKGAWATIISAFLAATFFAYWKLIVGMFIETQDFSVMLIMTGGLAVGLTVGIIVSLLTRPGKQSKLKQTGQQQDTEFCQITKE